MPPDNQLPSEAAVAAPPVVPGTLCEIMHCRATNLAFRKEVEEFEIQLHGSA